MGHRRRRAGEGFRTAEADREIGDLERVEEGERLLLSALQIEREGRSRAGAMTVTNVGLARAFLEEPEIADLLDLRVTAQEIADLGRIPVCPLHPQLKSFEAAQEHPGGVRVADRADRVADHADL